MSKNILVTKSNYIQHELHKDWGNVDNSKRAIEIKKKENYSHLKVA